MTYKQSGVDIDRADAFLKAIRRDVAGTFNLAVIKSPGAFGGLFAFDKKKYKEPVLVSSTDGVGTKLLIAKAAGRHDTVGIDAVAMNVNDILCAGARPLFFLDYLACGRLNPDVLKQVVKGITRGCRLAGCALIGGETAEMPGIYKRDDYDVAGFAVGVVEKSRIIDGRTIREGDRVIGLPSSGLHSNGFSLVRKVLSLKEQKKMSRELLRPTRIYTKEVLAILERFSAKGGSASGGKVKGIAHITGGAFYEKLTKILPPGKCFVIDKSWPVPKIFHILQKKGKITNQEMFRTFNMGIGLALVFPAQEMSAVKIFLKTQGIRFYEIGRVINHPRKRIVL